MIPITLRTLWITPETNFLHPFFRFHLEQLIEILYFLPAYKFLFQRVSYGELFYPDSPQWLSHFPRYESFLPTISPSPYTFQDGYPWIGSKNLSAAATGKSSWMALVNLL